MPVEIERKFLVRGEGWRSLGPGKTYRQGYIATGDGRATVRIRTVGDRGYLTLKGKSEGMTRPEFEYPIPREDAQSLLDTLCDLPLIEKTRYAIPWGDLIWEVDEFSGDNAGLILAEVELTDERQPIELPPWIGEEVTGDPRYYNVNLAQNPYRTWT